MNKTELVSAVAKQAERPKTEVGEVLEALSTVIADELTAGGEIHLTGIGKFSVKARPARTARNPRTGESVKVAARNVAKFTTAKQLKDILGNSKVKGGKAAAKAAPAKAPAKKAAAPAKKAGNVVNLDSRRAAPAKAPAKAAAPAKAPAKAAAPAKRRVIR